MSMLLKAGFAHVSPDTDLINDGNNIELLQTDTKKIWILKKSEYTQIKSVVINFGESCGGWHLCNPITHLDDTIV